MDKTTRTGLHGWVRGLLFASLALNLLIAGLAVGVVLKGPPRHASPEQGPALPYTRAFDEDQRRTLRRAFRGEMTRRAGRGDVLADYNRALALLRADPFDAAALRDALKKQHMRADSRRTRGQEILLDMLGSLSVEERQAYADRLEREVTRISERRGR